MKKSELDKSTSELWKCYLESPFPSLKVNSYFPVYAEIFSHLRGEKCTFIETGIYDGGSLFMWKNWLGKEARVIGIDLNPDAKKWEKYGFEIYIGDQGSPEFWKKTLAEIGAFDVLLDDGGHQSFQQIVTLYEGLMAAKSDCLIVVEDTCTSFMNEFSNHNENSFLNYSKAATDLLLAKAENYFPGQFPSISNTSIVNDFKNVHGIKFYSGIVAFDVRENTIVDSRLVRNLPPNDASDFRYEGINGAEVKWPNMFECQNIYIKGGKK